MLEDVDVLMVLVVELPVDVVVTEDDTDEVLPPPGPPIDVVTDVVGTVEELPDGSFGPLSQAAIVTATTTADINKRECGARYRMSGRRYRSRFRARDRPVADGAGRSTPMSKFESP